MTPSSAAGVKLRRRRKIKVVQGVDWPCENDVSLFGSRDRPIAATALSGDVPYGGSFLSLICLWGDEMRV